MRTCIYDSPVTCNREVWADGELVEFVSMEWLMQKIPGRRPVKPWREGEVVGDREAMERKS